MDTVYIYTLLHPKSKKPFYVGASKHPKVRFSYHCLYPTSALMTVILKLRKNNKRPILKIIMETDIKGAIFWERFYYYHYTMIGHTLLQKECHLNYNSNNCIKHSVQ
jgi:hypothetical protein